MLLSFLCIPVLCLTLVIELVIGVSLVDSIGPLSNLLADISPTTIIGIHALASLVAAVCISQLLIELVPGKRTGFIFLLFLLSFFIPFIGAAGSWLAITFGAIVARHRHQENVFWQFTSNADLPFTAPVDRPHPHLDGRGFVEQLKYDSDTERLYNMVVASRHIRDSQSAPILKSAIAHPNERIRLVAYQMFDKKVNQLNREIVRLDAEAQSSDGITKVNTHMQIANNYWELLTLEGDEPLARAQLLDSAASHVQQAIDTQPLNANSNFLMGQILLKQGELLKATEYFAQAEKLGMPKDKVIPYVAEAAFAERDFPKLRKVLSRLDPAFRAYPPLSNVAEYWP